MADRRYRVLAIATHPVQYMAPIFRRMSANPALICTWRIAVSAARRLGTTRSLARTFSGMFRLLEGYSWSQVANRGSGEESFFGLSIPGSEAHLWREIATPCCALSGIAGHFLDRVAAAKSSNTAFLFGTDTTRWLPATAASGKRRLRKLFGRGYFGLPIR